MKRQLIALGAALALVGTLTACSGRPADNKGDAGTSGTNGSGTSGAAAGTAYPRSTRYGVNGAYDYSGYGTYAADPDGAVSPGHGNMARDVDNLGSDIAKGARDLVDGVGDVVSDVGDGIRDTGRAMGGAVDHNQI